MSHVGERIVDERRELAQYRRCSDAIAKADDMIAIHVSTASAITLNLAVERRVCCKAQLCAVSN